MDQQQFLIRLLAVLAALNCVIVPVLFAQPGRLFPLPGLYLIEIAALGVLGLTSLLIEPRAAVWRAVPWLAAGALLAFVLLGGLTIGFFLIPATVAFLAAGFLVDGMNGGPVGRYLVLFLIAAVVQSALMVMLAPVV